MKLEEVIKLDKKYYMNTFGDRVPVVFKRGEGVFLYNDNNEKYLDMLSGIAVNVLGHSHPEYVKALKAQAEKLIHTSSIYYIENQAKLAEKLVEASVFDKAFFANSGAEANECAIKLAKIYHYKKGNTNKNEIITLNKSFHGRTLATVAATGQEKYQRPYKPLTPGFVHIDANNIEMLKNAVNENTAAIMVELVQGESGVHPLHIEFVEEIRRICTNNDIIFIVDEVQTGIGRTGKLFAYENYNVQPDIITLAKALGGGVPIGGVLAKDFVAKAFEPGDHGTTFGGNPLATGTALAVLNILKEDKVIDNCIKASNYLKYELVKLKSTYPDLISDIRGIGLLIAVEFSKPIAKDVNRKLFEHNVLSNAIGDNTLRLAPPLIIKDEEINIFITALSDILKTI